MNGIPVLMYHALEDQDHPAGYVDKGDRIYLLNVCQFREQMSYLYRNGFQSFQIKEVLSSEKIPEKSVIITFDDGHESNYCLALPILKEFGFKAEFFLTTDWIGKSHYMMPEQIKKLSMEGMSIGSHGVTHAFLDDLSDEEIEKELYHSKKVLTQLVEKPIISLSAPGGRIKEGLISLAIKNSYRILCTSRPALLYDRAQVFTTIPRFTIRRNTSISDFICIVEKNESFIRNLSFNYCIFAAAKRIFGNRRYLQLRELLLWKNN